MSEDSYDDGLVHSHRWATEPPQPGILPPAGARILHEVHAPDVAAAMAMDQDDGLVHGHDWARQEWSRG